MGAFALFKDAKRGFSSNPLRPGRYVCRIDNCEFFDTNTKGEMWKNTLTVLAVEEGDHKVGEIVHTFFKASVGKQVFQQNLKSFMATVLNVEDDQIGEDDALEACKEDSPMKGLVTVVTGRKRPSKKIDKETGEPYEYTVYSWTACMDDAEIKEVIGEEAFKTFFPNG